MHGETVKLIMIFILFSGGGMYYNYITGIS
jgi:hypothetical protein